MSVSKPVKLLVLSLGLFLLIVGTVAWVYVMGLPSLFCEYRTDGIELIPESPENGEVIRYFEREGWDVRLDNYERVTQSLPFKENFVEASRRYEYFGFHPRAIVYVGRLNPGEVASHEGELHIFIENGNRIANQAIYTRIIEQLNTAFQMEITPANFNYVSHCS